MALQNRGLLKLGPGSAALSPIPVPRLRDDYILVKTVAVALNPTDWQTLDEPFERAAERTLLGCDFAGVVVEVGRKVVKNFKKGDRIAGTAHGGNDVEPEDGTFAEYIMVKGDIAFHIPANISFEEAATLGGGITTIALGFCIYLELPLIEKLKRTLSETETEVEISTNAKPILIYGGSSATGTLAIQFAKLFGFTVITTCSPRNFDLLRSLGADHVFDYNDPDCGPKIRAVTNNALHQVYDTIATDSTASICAQALSSIPSTPNKYKYVNLMGVQLPRDDVESIFYLGYTITGEEFWLEGKLWEASKRDFELGVEFFALLEGLLERGLVRNHPLDLRTGGLQAVLDGMRDLKEGRVSGVKLVYRVDESQV